MADQGRPAGPKYKQKPPKLLLTSSSSGEDFLAKQGQAKQQPAKGQASPTKRGKPPPAPVDSFKSSFEKSDSLLKGATQPSPPPLANRGSSFARDNSLTRRPPPPTPPPPQLQALGSQHVPSSPKYQAKRPPPESAWGSGDPLLSTDSPLAGVQRTTSAIISRAESKVRKDRQPHGAPDDVQKDEYQPLSRLLSKRKAGGGGEPSTMKHGDSMPLLKERILSKEKVLLPARSKVLESPMEGPKPSSLQKKGQAKEHTAKSASPERSSPLLSEPGNRELQDVTSDDAWASTPHRPAPGQKGRTEAAVARRGSQIREGEMEAFSYSAAASGNFKTFSKAAPKPPKARPGHDVKGKADLPPDILFETSTQQKELQSVFSKHGDLQPLDQGALRDLEGRLARANERVADLEAQLQKAALRHREELERERSHHKEDLERERSQHRSKLAEAVSEASAERRSALDRIQKEADERIQLQAKESQARMEEVQKQALAQQNTMKMRCDASVRELREQVESLQKQLKDAQQSFEGEKLQMMKSFEEKRKTELHAKNVEVQNREKELKGKEAELMEQQGRVQALTTSMQTLTTSLAQMKELNDISRTATQALEEKTKTQANYIDMLLKRQESMRAQAAKLMPIREAKRLAFRALLKGRAVEMIARACMPTDASLWNKAWAFQQLVCLIGGPRDPKESRQDAIESRLMQFRKEQMFLMAENERLMAKVAQLQQEGVNQRQSKVALLEQELVKESSSGLSVPTQFTKAMQHEEPNVRWLVSAVQHIVNNKMLWAFLRLQKVTTEAESNMTIDKLQKKFNGLRVSAYKEMAARIGLYRIAANMRCHRIRVEFSALFKLARYAAYAGQRAGAEAPKQQEVPAAHDPFLKEPAVLEPPLFYRHGSPNNNEDLDFNVPVAHQPPYYRQLPSVRNFRGRNVFLPMIDRSPPRQGYLPHPGYTSTHLTLGVPPILSRGRRANLSPGVPNAFPSGPYDATQPVDERGAIFRVRGAQQELGRVMMGEARDKDGARIVGKK